ncbi:hypothetical protein [Arthrobacter sp. 135MFCol5.1]|uniref:hypothetical protein n=1 Tax=Arthrobacter sp. 135MFCol5.1 TaxID=1158050 RepID=UPI00037F3AE3|nr:hypothetical protein [Arthrobacter sp. 135MFCol5.1]
MALLTTRQKQELIKPVLLFFLIAGFIGGLWEGNPVAIAILVVVLLLVGLWIFFKIRKGRRIAAAKTERARRQERRHTEALAEVQRRMIAKPARPKQEQVTVKFKIPVMSDDTLDSLTVRVMEYYAQRDGTIPIAEAKAMAAKALAEQQAG